MVSHWSLSDRKFPKVCRTLHSILDDINNGVIWVVSTRPLISNSFRHFINPLVTVTSAQITIGITVILMCHSFFNSLGRCRYLSFFSLFFQFYLVVSWNDEVAYSASSRSFTDSQYYHFKELSNYYTKEKKKRKTKYGKIQ